MGFLLLTAIAVARMMSTRIKTFQNIEPLPNESLTSPSNALASKSLAKALFESKVTATTVDNSFERAIIFFKIFITLPLVSFVSSNYLHPFATQSLSPASKLLVSDTACAKYPSIL